MGKFASQADATEAFLDDRITRDEYAAALDEFLAPQRARRRTAAPSKVEERPTADIRKASAELVSAKQEKALERGEDSTALQDVIDREQPRRHLFGTPGKALGFIDDPRKSREELTLREQAARTFQPKIIRSPARQLLDKGEITPEQAAEQFVIEKEEKRRPTTKVPILPTMFGYRPLSQSRINQIIDAQKLPEGFPVRLTKVAPVGSGAWPGETDLGISSRPPEIIAKISEARKIQVGETELDLGLALMTAGASIPYQTLSQKERRKAITPLDEDRGLSLTSDGLFMMRIVNMASDAGFEFVFGLPVVGLGPGDALGIVEKARLALEKEDETAPATLGEVLGDDERPVISAMERLSNAFSVMLDPGSWASAENQEELKDIVGTELGAVAAQLKEVASIRTIGETTLGIKAEERLQTRGERPLVLPDENPVSASLRRMMISLERGSGLSGSTENAAVKAFGDIPEVRGIGVLAGMPVEILAPWELAFIKPFSALAKTFRGASAAMRVSPKSIAQGDAVMAAFRKSEIDVGQLFAEEYANRLRLGKAQISDLPEEIQQLANEAAQLRYGRTLDEILSEAGLARVTPDEIADAPLPATALSGRARGQRPAQASGAVLPEFRTPATSMADFYKKVTAGVEGEDLNVRASRRPGVQFDLSPHIGYDRLVHLDPEQTIATKSYVLLNQLGELVDSGNLNQIILKMLDRAEGGDTISFGAHRRVGEWGETRRLSSNFHFSSPDEKKIIDLFVKNNPKATPAKLRFINRGAEVVALGSRIIDPAFTKRQLLRALQGHPSTPVRRLTPQELQVATLVDDAYRLWAKGEMGSHKLDLLPWGGTATRAERNAIVSRTKADFKRAGADLAGLGLEKAPDGGLTNRLKINPSQRAQLNRLSNEVGSAVSLKEGVPFTLRELEELRIGVMRSHAEITTDASLAMRGTLPLSEFVMDSLFIATKSTNRVRFRKLTKDRGRTVVERFFQDPDDLARAPRTRQLIKEFQRELANVADELLLDLQKIRAAARTAGVAEAINAAGKANVRGVYAGLDKAFGGFDVSAPLLDLMRGYRPIPPRELQVLDQIATIPAIHDAARAFELRDEVLRHVKHLKAGEFGLHAKGPSASAARHPKVVAAQRRLSDLEAETAKVTEESRQAAMAKDPIPVNVRGAANRIMDGIPSPAGRAVDKEESALVRIAKALFDDLQTKQSRGKKAEQKVLDFPGTKTENAEFEAAALKAWNEGRRELRDILAAILETKGRYEPLAGPQTRAQHEALRRGLEAARPVGAWLDAPAKGSERLAAAKSAVREAVAAAEKQQAKALSQAAGQVFDAMKQLRVRKNAEMFALTKDWIRSHIPQVSKVDERVDAILNSLKQPEIRAIYDEIYGPIRRGKDGLPLRGPMLDTFLNENFSKLDRPTMNEASVNFVLEQRFREIKTRVIGRMVEEELGITSAYFKRAVADTLAGEHTTLGAQGQVIYTHPQHIQAKVMGYMRRLGLEPESAEAMVDFNGIAVPESLKVMMDRAEQLGATNSRQVYQNAYLNKLLNLQKQNMTYGLGFLRPAYVLGNALGGLFQIHATLGTAKLFSSMKTMSGNPMMVTELIKRTGNLEGMVIVPPRSEFGRVFRTKDGAIYHIDDIEKDIRRYGVDQAIGGFENRVSLLEDLGRNQPMPGWIAKRVLGERGAAAGASFVGFMKRNVVGWQEILREFSDVPERSMRIGVYLNELKAGARPADAAATARKALYDFSSLTDFERQNMRWAFMFYTFQRKNADAMLKALADHPERIAQQFRFFRNQREAFNQSDFEAASERNADLSRVILGRDDVILPDGTAHPSYRHLFYMSAPLGAPEYFLHLNEYVQGALNFDLTRMFQELGDGLTTPLKLPVELATLRDPGSGYSIESYGSNELPPYVDDEWGPFGMLGMLFDPTAVELKRTTDQSKINPAATAELLGTPAVYVAGNPDGNPIRERFSQAMWLIAKELLGSSIGEHTRRVKAFQHWNDPNPIAQDRNLLEKAGPSLYYALGLRGQKQRSPTEALREARSDREAEIKAETRDVRSKGR